MNISRPTVVIATALVIGMTTSAHAAGLQHTVAVGGSSAPGSHPFIAASTGTIKFSVKNNAGTVVNLNCSSLTASGTISSGTAIDPVGTITSTTWSGCRIPGGSFTFTQSGAWHLAVTGSNATTAYETLVGKVDDVAFSAFTTSSPALCSFTVSGQMDAELDEATQRLVIDETGYTGHLVLSNVGPCLGQMQTGNRADLAATLNVTSPDGVVNVS
jgi:hypothetical protein